MTRIAERTVLFADLRGSTALYETLGNAEATSVVTHTVAALGRAVPACGGTLVKTLGYGSLGVAAVLVGADSMSRAVGVPTYLADVIVACTLLAVLTASMLTRYRLRFDRVARA